MYPETGVCCFGLSAGSTARSSSGGGPGWGGWSNSEQIQIRQGRELHSCHSVLRHCFLHMAMPESWAGVSCQSCRLSPVQCTVVIHLAIDFLPLLPTSPPSLVLPLFLLFFPRGSVLICPSAEKHSTSVLFCPYLPTLESYAFVDHVCRMLKQAH